MTVKQIKNIDRKDVPIYYKMFYKADAEIELRGKSIEMPIEFSLETKPTGMKEILVTVTGEVDYPLVPLIKKLKEAILCLERDVKLPQ